MRLVAVVISAGVLAVAMALPALLFAQDQPPPTEPAVADEPPAEAPPGEPDPGDSGDTSAAEPPPATPEPTDANATSIAPAVAKGSVSVSMQDFVFSPASVTIPVGGSVTWTNAGEEDHTATGSGFATGTVGPGGSASQTFSTAGTFSYVCDFHPNMKGTVVVGSDPGAAPGTTAAGGTDPGTGAPLGSEAAAGALPGAAGSASGLPATGESEPPLLVLGLGLVGCGAAAALLARWREREDLR
jgi:plastocyanin